MGKLWAVLALGLACAVGGCAINPMRTPHEIGAKLNSPRLDGVKSRLWTRIHDGAGGQPRREYARDLIAQSDLLCEDYLIGVSFQRNAGAGGLDLAALAFSSAGAVTTPLRNAQLLAQISTLLQGSRTKLSDTIFGGKDYPLLYAAVRNGRAAQKARLVGEINGGVFDTWSALAIYNEISTYHLDCGVNYALREIAIAIEQKDSKTPPPATPAPKAPLPPTITAGRR